ncbi:MAG: 50S ribosomal protein L30 [Nanoarchaeota archaeon]|nr:50S ribosomal protein L30 [Nanoarchaeota archaeon]
MKKIAVIRIRGNVNLSKGVKDTFKLLRLYRKNCCVVADDSPSFVGMIKKVKDYVTYGEISEETYNALLGARGEEYKGRTEDSKGKIKYNKFITVNGKKIKPFFRLSPPKGGFDRKGIKVSFKAHGALGYRADKINDLLKRMI